MRRSTFSLAAVVGFGACAPSVHVGAETAAVRARGEAMVAAERARDTEGVLAAWAEDGVMQSPGSPQIQGHQALRAMYNDFFATVKVKQVEDSTTHVQISRGGDLAYDYGITRMIVAGPQGDLLAVGKYLTVWEKINGEWYIAAMSLTNDAPVPEPVRSH